MKAKVLSTIVIIAASFGVLTTSRASTLTFAAPIVFSQAGTVTLTLNHSAGGYDHLLYLGPTLMVFPDDPPPIMALTDVSDPSSDVRGYSPANINDTVSLGSFSANEEVIFRLVNVGSERFGEPGVVPDEISEIFSGSLSHANPDHPNTFFTLIEDVDEFTRIVRFEDLFSTNDQTGFLAGHDVRFTLQLTPVPIPAAVWLFGSGVIGLIGLARRRKRA